MWTVVAQYNRLQPHINTVLMWQCFRQTELQCYKSDCDCVRRCQGWNRLQSVVLQKLHNTAVAVFWFWLIQSTWFIISESQQGHWPQLWSDSKGRVRGQEEVSMSVGWLVGWLVGGSVRSGQVSFCHDNSCLGDKKLQRYLQKSNSCHQKRVTSFKNRLCL